MNYRYIQKFSFWYNPFIQYNYTHKKRSTARDFSQFSAFAGLNQIKECVLSTVDINNSENNKQDVYTDTQKS